MGKSPMDRPVGVPKWDPALEALVRDEYTQLGRPLGLADFRRLGRMHKIRFHDIMATMEQLDRHGRWHHHGTAEGAPADEAALSGLYVQGRVDEDLAEQFAVTWAPSP